MTRLRTSAIIFVALFAVLILASVIADRLGAAAGITSLLMLVLGVLALATAAILSGSMRGPVFQMAATTGTGALTAALAALCLGVACITGGMPPAVQAAPALGMAFALLVQGLVLPAMPASVPDQSYGDFIARRFGSRLLAALACLAGLGLMVGLGAALGGHAVGTMAHLAGLPVGTARWIVLLLVVILVVPGGARSIVTAAVVALAVAGVGWTVATGHSFLRHDWTPLVVAEASLDAVAATPLMMAGVAVAAGSVTLLHLPISSASPRQNRQGHAWACLLLVGLVALSAAATAPPAHAGLVPPVLQAVTRLAPMLLIPLALAMTIHVICRTLVRDVLYRLLERQGTASGRLALQRLASILIAGWFILLTPPLPGADSAAVRVALLLGAAVPLPLLLLARWARVDWRAASCGVAAAFIAAGAAAGGFLDTSLALAGGALSCLVAGALATTLFPAASRAELHRTVAEMAA